LSVVVRDTKRGTKFRIGNGPLTVDVMPSPGLSGLPDRVDFGQELRFRITNIREEYQDVEVSADDDMGTEARLHPSERIGNSLTFKHLPKTSGQHRINVVVNRIPVEGSPFRVDVVQPEQEHTGAEATVWGRGICRDGACAGDNLAVNVWNCPESIDVSVSKGTGFLCRK
jgi:hypothetical protein